MSSLTTKMDQIKTKIFRLKITDQYRDRERERVPRLKQRVLLFLKIENLLFIPNKNKNQTKNIFIRNKSEAYR